ncbi:hypothetical protein WJX73_010877 [Symbiochloris irregularis]|uniref:Uncharacterized protein n=1 Tax=Symbiochloris irregularis TaxID=706552 RepID=A0AAW1PI80_9CHLO
MWSSFTRKRDASTNPIGSPSGSGTLPDDVEGPPAARPREDGPEPSEVRIDALEARLAKLTETVKTQGIQLAAYITSEGAVREDNARLKAELVVERAKVASLQEASERLDHQVKQLDAKVTHPTYASVVSQGAASELRAAQAKNKEDIEQLRSQAEQQDRQSRAANIMVFGLQESDSQSPAEQVSECLRSVGAPGRERIVRAVRLGQQQGGQPRPVKVIMATQADAVNVLRRTRELRQRRQVRVDKDLTPTQARKRSSQLKAAKDLRDLGYFTVFNAEKLLYFKKGSDRREVFDGRFPSPV